MKTSPIAPHPSAVLAPAYDLSPCAPGHSYALATDRGTFQIITRPDGTVEVWQASVPGATPFAIAKIRRVGGAVYVTPVGGPEITIGRYESRTACVGDYGGAYPVAGTSGVEESPSREIEIGRGATVATVLRHFGVSGPGALRELAEANPEKVKVAEAVGVAGFTTEIEVKEGDVLRVPDAWPDPREET